MANWKQAIREDWKFNTNVGTLNLHSLFTAADTTLIQLENDLKDEVKKSKVPNRFSKTSLKDKLPKLKLEIVSEIIDTIIEEREEATNAQANKEEAQKLMALIAKKKESALEELSVEELEKRLAKIK